MKLIATAAALLVSLSACKKDKKADKAEPPPPAKKADAAPAPTTSPDAAAAAATFTAKGLTGLEIGAAVDQDAVAKAAPGAAVEKEEETAEGEVVGVMFHAKKDGALLFTARPTDGKLASLEFHSGYKGPKDVEPGVTKYEAARDAIGVKDCTGGAEAHADEIMCSTNDAAMRIAFADPETKHMATPIAADKQDTVLAGRVVKWIAVSAPE